MTTISANAPIHIGDADFETTIAQRGLVLIDFWAPWCAPCRAIAPILDQLATEYGDRLTIAKINIDEHQDRAQAYGVRAIPTLILFRDGVPVDTLVGSQSKASLAAAIERAGNQSDAA